MPRVILIEEEEVALPTSSKLSSNGSVIGTDEYSVPWRPLMQLDHPV